MQAAPLPANESERLQALYDLLILDTPPEQRFDRIAAFAAAEFDVPIVLVTLVDAGRQWFKARVGMPLCETGRDVSFCAHAILTADIMVVHDALDDPRFADNPLVAGDPASASMPVHRWPCRPARDLVVLELTQRAGAEHG